MKMEVAPPANRVKGRVLVSFTRLFAIACVAALVPSSASAASSIASIDFGAPKAEIASIVKARVVADESTLLYIKTRATGGPACAPTPQTDPGVTVGWGVFDAGEFLVGDNTRDIVTTWSEAGPRVYCAWLRSRASSAFIATLNGTFTIASPTGAISGVVVPATAPRDQTFAVRVTGSSEVSRRLLWRIRPVGEPPCAVSPVLEPGNAGFEDAGTVLGSFSNQLLVHISDYGRYRLCIWVASSTSDTAPLGLNESQVWVPAPASVRTVVTIGSLPARIHIRKFVQVSAIVTAKGSIPRGVCQVQRFVAGRWEIIARGGVGSLGKCTMTIRIGRLGREQLRIAFVPKSASIYRGSRSAFSTVTVAR